MARCALMRRCSLFKSSAVNSGADDVAIDITHCGICHSDLHFARGEWGEQPSPAVPGHEIVGVVRAMSARRL